MKAFVASFAVAVLVAMACGPSATPKCTGATCSCLGSACTCTGGASCDIVCGTYSRCQPSCTNVGQCNAVCRDDCTGKCTGAGSVCTFQCNANCNYDCSNSRTCIVNVGDASAVDCTGAGTCEVTCAGSCKVKGCAGSTCQIRCQAPDGSTEAAPTQDGC